MLDTWYQPCQPEVVRMTTQAPARPGHDLAARPLAETRGWSAPGIRVLGTGVVLLIAGTVLLIRGINHGAGPAHTIVLVVASVLLIAAGLALHGLTPVVAGEARVVQLFGRYRGTVRAPGLHWVNPFARRRKVSVRLRNHETAVAKVNDADGNPIEIAAVVVWQVRDTAQALYAVDDCPKFVAIQTETAVRRIASSYPYTSHGDSELSLRGNADEITQAMLRQQQANAVVGARQRIVEGAVGMVQLALQRLEAEGVVELDEERKAAMVSNLLVVLCSEQATQQVVNTGSLYQ